MSTARQTAPGIEQAPLPPLEVALRSGSSPGPDHDPYENWIGTGRACRAEIERLLPDDWSWTGKRVLDFGCGAGRTLRHFLPVAGEAEFHGCDIYADGVDWVDRNLSPPLTVFPSSETPPLDRPDGSYDVIYALSVFTHLTDEWSNWLCEMRRLLRPGGFLISTFVGAEFERPFLREPYGRDEIGMNILFHRRPWALGGPLVLHSDWWLEAHWGRGFEIAAVDSDPPDPLAAPHRWWLFRRTDAEVTPEEFERPEPGEERELAALRHNVAQVQHEVEMLTTDRDRRSNEVTRLRRQVDAMRSSRGWRALEPVRRLKRGGTRRS